MTKKIQREGIKVLDHDKVSEALGFSLEHGQKVKEYFMGKIEKFTEERGKDTRATDILALVWNDKKMDNYEVIYFLHFICKKMGEIDMMRAAADTRLGDLFK